MQKKYQQWPVGLTGYPYPGQDMEAAWEKVLFNQFHDIMGGCSIKEAYEDARNSHGWAIHTAEWVLNGAMQKISWNIDTMKEGIRYLSKEKHGRVWEQEDEGSPFVVFNPLSWEVKTQVPSQRSIQDDNRRSGKSCA
ncbi:MAG: hypothetical protein ACOX22_00230 [Caldicoprobacterales bacterium]